MKVFVEPGGTVSVCVAVCSAVFVETGSEGAEGPAGFLPQEYIIRNEEINTEIIIRFFLCI